MINKTLLQRRVNDIEFDADLPFNAVCEILSRQPWAKDLTARQIALEIRRNGIKTKSEQPKPIGFDNLRDRLWTPVKRPLCVCYGMGVDSTALLIHLARMYNSEPNKCPQYRPDIITFADTGNEKKETYEYEPVIQDYLRQVGFPPITKVRYVPEEKRVKHGMYYTLEQNCLMNATLPSLAFGFKKCSLKWKRAPQDKYRADQTIVQEAWAHGLQAICAIGYDAGPKDQRRVSVMDDEQYEYWYPLVELGWDRERCIEEIVKEGLPGWSDWTGQKWVKSGGQPVKSACWYCPSNSPEELHNFSLTPHGREYLRGIVRMEDTAEPHLTSIEGLWRKGVKGTRTGRARPGRMADYIHQNGLLDADLPALPVLQQGEHQFSDCEQCAGCF